MNKKIKDYQKKRILALKHFIIESDNTTKKDKAYTILIKAIKQYHEFNISDVKYKNNISIDYKIANSKISNNDTIIFSIGTALNCYSAKKGYCQLYKNKKCYALKNELQYNFSILFKDRQKTQFEKMNAFELANEFIKIKAKYPKIKYIRLNESAEIEKKHMQKLNTIANIIEKHNIKLYTYTHNIEISKDDITSNNFAINSSNKNIKLSNRFLSFDKAKNNRILNIQKQKTNKRKISFVKCNANCETCKICTSKRNITILCDIH